MRQGPWAAPAYAALRSSRLLQLAFTALQSRGGVDAGAAAAGGGAPEPSPADRVYLSSPPPPWPEAWRVTGELLRRTSATAWASGADYLLASASIGVQVHPDPELRRRFAEALGVEDLQEPERRLAALAAADGYAYLALTPALAERARRTGRVLHGAGGFGHWNREGHRVAAELLAHHGCHVWATGTAADAEGSSGAAASPLLTAGLLRGASRGKIGGP